MLSLLLFVLVAVVILAVAWYAMSLAPLPDNLKHLIMLVLVVALAIALVYRVAGAGGPVVLWP